MANLYGVANAPLLLGMYNTIGGVPIACPAGVETNVVNSNPQIGPSQGWFSPIAWVNLAITLGATPPATCGCALRVASGADVANASISPILLVAGATVNLDFCLVGAAQQTPWMGAGSIINISVFATGQAVTCQFGGTWCTIGIIRAPDQ